MNEHRLIIARARVAVHGVAAAILVACIASCESTTSEAEMEETTQLLLNTDVERGEGSPDWWLPSGSAAQHVFSWANGTAVSGRRSLGVRSASAAPSSVSGLWIQRAAPGDPTGVTYVLSASVKLEQMTGAGVAIAIRGDDTTIPGGSAALAFATTQGRQPLTGTQDWTRVSVELSGVPANVDLLSVYLLLLTGSNGTVYFDDITLSTVKRTGPAAVPMP